MSAAVQRFSSRGSGVSSPIMKRLLALIAASFATAAAAQPAQPQVIAGQTPLTGQAPWDPAAPYISAGQDEPGYRSWYLSAPFRAAQVKGFNEYLLGAQVAGVVPTWQLLRTATSWHE